MSTNVARIAPVPDVRESRTTGSAVSTEVRFPRVELPAPPPAVEPLLAPARVRGRYNEFGEFLELIEEWKPPKVPAEKLPEVEQYLEAVEAALAPAEKGALLGRILTLLSHYRLDHQPPAIERAIAEDWAEDLGEFPQCVVDAAARWWRRNKKWRPTICEIRQLCEAEARGAFAIRDRLRRMVRNSREWPRRKWTDLHLDAVMDDPKRGVPRPGSGAL